jgi:hypothetical protein
LSDRFELLFIGDTSRKANLNAFCLRLPFS